jgi:hypothetical protein
LIAGGGQSDNLLETMNEQQIIKLKVASVGRMRRMYRNLIEN